MTGNEAGWKPVSSGCERPLFPGWRWGRLGDICQQDRQIIEPGSKQAHALPYLGLESIACQTGRILYKPHELLNDEGNSSTFYYDARHVLYGKLRPYLNKVALPDESGRCTTEAVPLLPRGADRAFLAWLLRRPETVSFAMRGKTGSRMPRADIADLLEMPVPIPPLVEQRRIAATLGRQMEAVERARAAAEAQLAAARELPAAYLRESFAGDEARTWPTQRLGDISTLLPSKSIATDGDAVVKAITTACLTEHGFNPDGVKVARMRAQDVAECAVSVGEVLIARSNTAELVGRVARYEGDPAHVVASDLTIRMWPESAVEGRFLAAYLSYLYLSGYWKERAGGASGSMKKITRTQVLELAVPVPLLGEQESIAVDLDQRMKIVTRAQSMLHAQFDNINELPATLLRQAFSGAL